MLTSVPSQPSAREAELSDAIRNQTELMRRLLLDGVALLRDDAPFIPNENRFGNLSHVERSNYEAGATYTYRNRNFSELSIEISTIDDPEDLRPDRSKVNAVPFELEFGVSPALADLNAATVQSMLQLEDYWVSDGEVIHDNKLIRSPQTPDVQTFRYRSKNTETSKFLVDVELRYYSPHTGSLPPELVHVYMHRAYSILTPEQREQKRLEQEHAKRAKYGYMGLRTGMLCPETGWWEGWSVEGLIDKQVVRQNNLFPQACFPPNRYGVNGERLVDAQWMWSSPFDEHPEG
jgi:hypothetical protein